MILFQILNRVVGLHHGVFGEIVTLVQLVGRCVCVGMINVFGVKDLIGTAMLSCDQHVSAGGSSFRSDGRGLCVSILLIARQHLVSLPRTPGIMSDIVKIIIDIYWSINCFIIFPP